MSALGIGVGIAILRLAARRVPTGCGFSRNHFSTQFRCGDDPE